MILLARHGRTESNASGLLLGRADPPLDQVGRDQAARLAAALVDGTSHARPINRIVASPLLRAAETASVVGEALGIDVTFDDRFIELDYGRWDQRPLADVAPAEWAAWRADVDFAPPGGESLATLGRRVRAALDGLAGAGSDSTGSDGTGSDSTVLVVTHVSPIKAAVAWAVGGGDAMAWRLFVAPASITRIATTGPAPSLHSFNDCSHLA